MWLTRRATWRAAVVLLVVVGSFGRGADAVTFNCASTCSLDGIVDQLEALPSGSTVLFEGGLWANCTTTVQLAALNLIGSNATFDCDVSPALFQFTATSGTGSVQNISFVNTGTAILVTGVNAFKLVVAGCTFSYTSASAIDAQRVTVSGSQFHKCSSSESGAAIAAGSSLTISNSTFTYCNGPFGAVQSTSGAVIRGSTFTYNTVSANAGSSITAPYATIENCLFGGNSGVPVLVSSSATVANSSFVGNRNNVLNSGGALIGPSLTVTGSIFSYNTAASNAGAILMASGCITDSVLTGNVALGTYAGALFAVNDVTLERVQFFENWSGCDGGGVVAAGGLVIKSTFSSNMAPRGSGIALTGGPQSMTIVDSYFTYNEGNGDGGAIFSPAVANAGTVYVYNSYFMFNYVGHYGGALHAGGNMFVVDSVFYENSVGHMGGVVHLDGQFAVLTMLRCNFTNNIATGGGTGGGALSFWKGVANITNCRFEANTAIGLGGAMFAACAEVVVADCEFVGNYASAGGSILSCDRQEPPGPVATILQASGLSMWDNYNVSGSLPWDCSGCGCCTPPTNYNNWPVLSRCTLMPGDTCPITCGAVNATWPSNLQCVYPPDKITPDVPCTPPPTPCSTTIVPPNVVGCTAGNGISCQLSCQKGYIPQGDPTFLCASPSVDFACSPNEASAQEILTIVLITSVSLIFVLCLGGGLCVCMYRWQFGIFKRSKRYKRPAPMERHLPKVEYKDDSASALLIYQDDYEIPPETVMPPVGSPRPRPPPTPARQVIDGKEVAGSSASSPDNRQPNATNFIHDSPRRPERRTTAEESFKGTLHSTLMASMESLARRMEALRAEEGSVLTRIRNDRFYLGTEEIYARLKYVLENTAMFEMQMDILENYNFNTTGEGGIPEAPVVILAANDLASIRAIEFLTRQPNVDFGVQAEGTTLYHICVANDRLDILELFISMIDRDLLRRDRINPNVHDAAGNTPLYEAVRSQQGPVVQALLKLGADPNLANVVYVEMETESASSGSVTRTTQSGDTALELALRTGFSLEPPPEPTTEPRIDLARLRRPAPREGFLFYNEAPMFEEENIEYY